MILYGAVLVGTVALAVGWYLRSSTTKLTSHGVKTSGTVVSSVRKTSINSGNASYRQVQFVTARGEEILFDARVSSLPGAQEQGQKVPVIYDPADPQGAVINSFIELQLPWIIFVSAGLGLSGVSGALLIWRLF